MDSHFSAFMIEQLQKLIKELKDAKEPSNKPLHEAILAAARSQYDARHKMPF